MSFLTNIVQGAGRILGGVVKGTPVGQVITGAYAALRPKAPTGPTVLGNLPAIFTGEQAQAPRSGGVVNAVAPIGGGVAKGSAPNLPQLGSGPATRSVFSDVHAGSSSTAVARVSGGTTGGHYTKKGYWSNRRRPRLNPMNVHAARRAVRRIHSAEKLFRKIFSVTHPGMKKTRVKPKFGRKR